MHRMTPRIRLGMVGGGQGAFIGAVHRIAATMDFQAELVAGAFSSSPEKALASGRELGIAEVRNYVTWSQMLERESALPPDQRVEVVSIVTPNVSHYAIAKAFVSSGFNVVCDKPMVTSSEQAEELVRLVKAGNVVFGVTYNYTGYPMVKRAAEVVREGKLGRLRKIIVEYHQGWLSTKLEDAAAAGAGVGGQKQAAWRTDPLQAGIGGAIGDIGSHAENLVSTVTGLRIRSLCADISTFIPGRRLDDDGAVLLRFEGGARGTLSVSQVCIGEENNLTLRVFGSEGSLFWRQENPNELFFTPSNGARRTITRAGAEAGPLAAEATRLPPGHPEGFIEAFANIYRGVFEAIRAKKEGRARKGLGREFPTVQDGARGVRFIEKVVESSQKGGWVEV
jgi:predicted dehydrogenase